MGLFQEAISSDEFGQSWSLLWPDKGKPQTSIMRVAPYVGLQKR
jgi:hypothetical protein